MLFTSRAALAGLSRAVLDYAVRTFTPKDILGFLGRRWDRRFDGEVHTHYEDGRWFGTRIKHRMKTNWLKMYDKFGLILRVETVINSAKKFWVDRTQYHRDGTSSVGYYPMTKGVASLVDYQEQALGCNRRYLETGPNWVLTAGEALGYAGRGHDPPGDSSDRLAPPLDPSDQPHDLATCPGPRRDHPGPAP